MKPAYFFAIAVLAALPAFGWSYDSAFSLDFEEAADADGFTDVAGGNTVFVSGENTPADSPPYAVPPNVAAGYNNSKWLRTGSDVQPNGVSTAVYDGRAGGTTGTTTDFEATAEIYINPTYSERYQVGIFGRWTSGFSVFHIFYSRKTSTLPDGYGWRAGGSTSTYNAFGTGAEPVARWVRFKLRMVGAEAFMSVDRDLDGVYELVSPAIPVNAAAPGKIGFQHVINTGAGASIPTQFAYHDNLTYIPIASVSDWSVY